MSQIQIPKREYGRNFRLSEFNRSEQNHLFICGWENFDLDAFCGREPSKQKEVRAIKVSRKKDKIEVTEYIITKSKGNGEETL